MKKLYSFAKMHKLFGSGIVTSSPEGRQKLASLSRRRYIHSTRQLEMHKDIPWLSLPNRISIKSLTYAIISVHGLSAPKEIHEGVVRRLSA